MGGKSNVPLLKTDTIFSKIIGWRGINQQLASLLLGIGVAVLMSAFLYWFFGT